MNNRDYYSEYLHWDYIYNELIVKRPAPSRNREFDEDIRDMRLAEMRAARA